MTKTFISVESHRKSGSVGDDAIGYIFKQNICLACEEPFDRELRVE